jgi:AP-1-like transcription factor
MANMFNSQFNPASLSQNQQDLLMAALSSNRQSNETDAHPPSRQVFDFASGSLENPMFSSDQIPTFGAAELNSLSDQQFLDYLDRGNSIDYDSIAPGDIDLDNDDDEDSPLGDDSELHDKRKFGDDVTDNGGKRREGEEKVAKKPGRKPLTSEPTSVSLTASLFGKHAYVHVTET